MKWNNVPVPHSQVAAEIVDDEAVIVLADAGEVNVLNSVGTRVWQLSDGARNLAQIAEALADEFEVSLEQAQDDVREFMAMLVHAKMIELRDE